MDDNDDKELMIIEQKDALGVETLYAMVRAYEQSRPHADCTRQRAG